MGSRGDKLQMPFLLRSLRQYSQRFAIIKKKDSVASVSYVGGYLENTGGKFTPSYTPAAASGRWITMETADIDGDDDTDLLLGALNFPGGVPAGVHRAWSERKASLLILKNNLRQPGTVSFLPETDHAHG